MAEVARQVSEANIEDVIANHCYGLFELAAIHLSSNPPQLQKASVAIDAMGLLVDGLGDRLGEHVESLNDGLTQLRMAFVRISSAAAAAPAGDGEGPSEPDGSGTADDAEDADETSAGGRERVGETEG